ncbi:MAG: aminotransferase class I/II-fold pyridoxal phosphate-dependent enzyme [Candidatus Kapaibacterium sp.]
MIDRIASFGTSVFSEITALALRHGAVNLGQGFPDFDTPLAVRNAACAAISEGRNQYAVSHGEPVLRAAVAEHAERFYGHKVDADGGVCVTAGASEALWCTMFAFVEPGDEVIVFEPSFDVYIPNIRMAGGTVVPVTLHAPDFRFDPDELRAAFSPRTKLILVNTPHNPCGTVFNSEELSLIRDLCSEHDVIAVCDEVYEHIVFDANNHTRLATLDGMRGRCITISSGGKTFSSTGWKCGWAIGDEALIACIRRVHQFTVFASSTPFHHAIAAGLSSPDDFYRSLREDYTRRRDTMVDILRETPIPFHVPQGAYFIAADISGLTDDDGETFCRNLIEHHGIATIPMQKFYVREQIGRSLIRIAFCKKDETLATARSRFRAFTDRLDESLVS